jgi:hypothetical protein
MDFWTLVVTVITLILFIAALFFKGITHDLFLEAGVFLISVKIILTTYKNNVSVGLMQEKLDIILAEIKEKNSPNSL